MRQRRAHIAQRRCETQPFGGAGEGVGGGAVAVKFEADHVAALIAQKRGGEPVIGMIGAHRVKDAPHPRQARQRIGQPRRRRLRADVAQRESQKAAFRQPAVEGARRQPHGDGKRP